MRCQGTIREASLQVPKLFHRVALIAAALSSGLSFAGASVAQDLPPGDGHDIVQTACTMCHGVDVIASQRRSADEWKDVVSRMVGNGANLTDDQYVTVVKYLGDKLGPEGPAPTAQAAPPAAPADHAQH